MTYPEDSSPELPSTNSPEIDLIIGGEKYTLTWHNSLVRKFLVGEGVYDHILHRPPDGRDLFVFLDGEVGQQLRDLLTENSYPHRIDPILDNQTIEFYTRMQTASLEEEIKREFI